MLHIRNIREGLPLYRALSSEVRVSILEMLYENGPMRMSAISEQLGLTNGALTPHIKALADCSLITIDMAVGKHGVQKICCVNEESILIDPARDERKHNVYETEISVGQYTAYDIYPTCGIATPEHIIGEVDDPRYFASPERVNGSILWFGRGFVEYMIPNFLNVNQQLLEIQISLEIASEAPGCSEDWPSDIYFYLNGKELGYWTSPGDFGRVQGIYNPDWWFRNWNQHGMYKLLSVNESGTFIDGSKISEVTLKDLAITHGPSLSFRLSAPEKAKNQGGLTIFGRSFGNYHQDIRVRMHYRETSGRK
jgi:predicted transcriptional regulator